MRWSGAAQGIYRPPAIPDVDMRTQHRALGAITSPNVVLNMLKARSYRAYLNSAYQLCGAVGFLTLHMYI